MFGYVRPKQEELLVKDLTLYRAVYCGLCKYGGKKISRLTRPLLNYDFVLLALVRLALSGEKAEVKKVRCPYKLTRHPMLIADATYAHVCSCFAILTYLNNEDDVKDGKALKPRLLRPVLKLMKRKVKGYDGFYAATVANLDTLARLEAERCADIDAAADCCARIMSDAAGYGLDGTNGEIARQCGQHLGRFVYLTDAYDDLEDDAKSGNYNPFLCKYGSLDEALKHKENIQTTIIDSMNAFSTVYGLAERSAYDRLIYNIVELGSREAVSDITKEKTK